MTHLLTRVAITGTALLLIAFPVTSVLAQATDVNCNGCVDAKDIADRAVQRSKIANFAINTPKLNNYAVTTPKIKPGAVTGDKIAANAVGVTQIDPTQIQMRVGGSCSVGSSIASIAADGSVTCHGGHYGLVVLDGNDQEIGRFLSFTGTSPISPGVYWLLSAEGYYFAVRLGPSNTAIPPPDSGGSLLNQEIWYSNSGCSGDAYLEVSAFGANPNNGYVFDGGGGSGDGRQFYVPAGSAPFVPPRIGSRKGADTVCQNQSLYGEAYAIYPNDQAVTGVSTAGYTLPLTLR